MACEQERDARKAAADAWGKAQRFHTYATRKLRTLVRGLVNPTPEQRQWAHDMEHRWLDPGEAVANRRPDWPQPYWTIASWAEHRGQVAVVLPRLRREAIAAQRAYRDCLGAPPPPVEPVPMPATDQQADELLAHATGRCGRERRGHGHVGDPCLVRLGPDRSCQYHGGAVVA